MYIQSLSRSIGKHIYSYVFIPIYEMVFSYIDLLKPNLIDLNFIYAYLTKMLTPNYVATRLLCRHL